MVLTRYLEPVYVLDKIISYNDYMNSYIWKVININPITKEFSYIHHSEILSDSTPYIPPAIMISFKKKY